MAKSLLATMACGVFAWIYIRNHPHEHESANYAEREHIQTGLRRAGADAGAPMTMARVLRSPTIWLLFVGRILSGEQIGTRMVEI